MTTFFGWYYLFLVKRLLADGNPAYPSVQPLFIVGMRGGRYLLTMACIVIVSIHTHTLSTVLLTGYLCCTDDVPFTFCFRCE